METKIIHITAGKGPAECCWVVAQVLKSFIEDLKKNEISHQILHREKGTENGTLQSVSIQLTGNGLEKFLEAWLGTVQWIGKSSFRKFHKRKNWFIGIYAMEPLQQSHFNEKDITFQAIRSSGPGGQHANKVSSAIRATHTKTGLSVLVSDSRSQHQNKKTAIKRLHEKMAEHHNEQLKIAAENQWNNTINVQRGNPVRVFEGSNSKVNKTKKKYKQERNQLKTDLRKQLEQ